MTTSTVAWIAWGWAYWPSYAQASHIPAARPGAASVSGFSLGGLIPAVRREFERVGTDHRRRRIWLVIIVVVVLIGRRAVM